MEIIGKTDKRWVETISSKDTIKTELYNFEIDVEEMESGTAFQFQTSVVANEYYNPKATLVDIVISDPNWKETNLWWAQNWRPLHFTVFISGEKQKSKYVITEFYDLLLSYAAKIGKSGRSAWIGLEDLYSHFHRVFCSITWEILNRYSDIYAWDNFGELMFYTLFSPEIRKTKYKERTITKSFWEYVKNGASIANDFITLDETDNGGLYCLYLRDKTFDDTYYYYYGFTFIYVKSTSQIFEVPLMLFCMNDTVRFSTRCFIEGKEKSADLSFGKFKMNFENGYLRGRAFTFGLNLNDVFKYGLKEIL